MTDSAETTTTQTEPIEAATEALTDGFEISTEDAEAIDSHLDSVIDELGVTEEEDAEVEESVEAESASAEADPEGEIADDPTDHDQWDEARQALIDSGLEEDEVDAIPADMVLKAGLRKLGAAKPDEADDAEKQGQEQEAVEESQGFDAEAARTRLAEKLSDQFDDKEAGVIIDSMMDLVDMLPQSKPVAQDTTQIDSLKTAVFSMIEPLLIDRAVGGISDAFPELADGDTKQKVVETANKMWEDGVKAGSFDEMIELAAVKVLGKDRTAAIKKHQNKVNKAKRNGAPAARGGQTTGSSVDPVDSVIDDVVNQYL